MYPQLDSIFNYMTSNRQVGIKMQKKDGDYVHGESNASGRKNVFLAADVLSSGLAFTDFIKKNLSVHGGLKIIPVKMNGNGVLNFEKAAPVQVEPMENNTNHNPTTPQPAYNHTQPIYNGGMNGGMAAVQVISSHWEREYKKAKEDKERLERKLEDLRDESHKELKDARNRFENKLETLNEKLKQTESQLATAEQRLELAVEKKSLEQKSWAESPAIEKLASAIGPVAASAMAKGNAPSAPVGMNANLSKTRQDFMQMIAKSPMKDEDLELLHLVGDKMSNPAFLDDLAELLTK